MRCTFRWTTLAALLVCAVAAQAQTAGTSAEATGKAAGQAEANGKSASTEMTSTAQAGVDAEARATQQIESIKAKGAKVSAKARGRAEARLAATAKRVNELANEGESKVSDRLATEFGMTAEALVQEKQTLDAGWGEIMIAHTLIANSSSNVTMEQLFELRHDGTGWGQIAAGMGFHLGEVVSAVNAESRVASGLAKADGSVAVVHGEGAKAGAHADVGARAGAQAGHAGAGVGVNAGANASIPNVKIR